MCTDKCAQLEGHFQRLEASVQTPGPNIFSSETAHCQHISATFSNFPRSLMCNALQGKCKNASFPWTVIDSGTTHLSPTMNTCKVGAWWVALDSLHSLLVYTHRLAHVCWCTLIAL